jgi:ABC-type nitrate/sulfonate/bicarbonate transport system substrate-binding protein
VTTFSRRTFLQRSAFGAGLITFGGALLSACGGDDDDAEAEGLDVVTCQLGWKKLAQFGGHFMAQELGYFAEEGIKAEFLSGGPNIDVFSVVNSGQAMVGDANGSAILQEVVNGSPIQAFCTIFQQTPNALMSLEDNPVLTMKDLEGKTVAVPTGEQELIDVLVQNAGGDPSKVKYVPVGTDPSILSSGQVDAYIGYGTSQGVALQEAGVPVHIVYFGDLGNPDYGNAIFAKKETIEKQHDVLVRWLRADIKGWQYAVDHPEEMAERVWELYNKETAAKLEDETKSAIVQVPLITKGVADTHGLMWIDREHFETVGELYKEAGLIDGEIDYDEVFTQEILLAAGAKA